MMNDSTTKSPPPRRVLFAAGSAQLGGGNRFLLLTAAELRRRGVQVRLLFPSDGPAAAEARRRAIDAVILPLPAPDLAAPWSTVNGAVTAMRMILSWTPQIVHANDITVARSLALAARFAGSTLVCHMHRPEPLTEREVIWAFRGLPKPHVMIDVCRATGAANGVLLRRHLPHTVHSIVPNGVDLTELAPSAPTGDSARCRVGCIANLLPVKRHDDLLDMLPRLAASHPSVELWLIGDDSLDALYSARLRQRCEAEAELRGRVRFLGRRDDVPALLGQLDLVIHAAEREACSLALLEALASGVPVVASDAGGNGEIIEDGKSGWLVPPGRPDLLAERAAAVLGDQQAHRRCAELGRLRIERHFDIHRTTAALLELYGVARAANEAERLR